MLAGVARCAQRTRRCQWGVSLSNTVMTGKALPSSSGSPRLLGVPETAGSQLAQRISVETGIPVKLRSVGAPQALGPEGEWSLLMLVREAIQNAVTHAAPKNIAVVLTFDHHCLHVEIEDEGCGFEPSTCRSPDGHHYGLIGMRERVEKLGGEFHLTSSP